MKKRILSTMMALAMCLSMLPAAAFAAEGELSGPQAPETAHFRQEQPAPQEREHPLLGAAQGQAEEQQDEAVSAVQALVDALPTAAEVTADDYDEVQEACDAYEALTAEQQAQITGAEAFEALFRWFNDQAEPVDDQGESAEHADHCLCGALHKTIGDHEEENTIVFTAWTDEIAAEQNGEGCTASNSLPKTYGRYYLTKDVTIDNAWAPVSGTVLCLNGHDITRMSEGEVFSEVIRVGTSNTFTLTDCKTQQGKITHGTQDEVTYTGTGVQNQGNFIMYGGAITGNVTRDDNSGGGVYNSGSFTMYGGSIENNKAGVRGGGVLNFDAFYLRGGSIKNNSAEYGGGVYCYTCIGEDTILFQMSGGSIENNRASSSGGGVELSTVPSSTTAFTMTGGSIKNNSASDGGGVYVGDANCTYTLSGGSVESNRVSDSGGGVFVYKGSFVMNGGQVTNNTAADAEASCGGGVCVYEDAQGITLGGTAKITGNKRGTSSSAENNLYLWKKKVITLDSEHPLSEGASIGLAADFNRQTVVENIGDGAKYFSVDDPDTYQLMQVGDDLVMSGYPMVVVGGVELALSDSYDDVLNDGGSVKYDKDTQTLTLTNATISTGYEFEEDYWAAIYAKNMELTIKLVGTNRVTAPEKAEGRLSCGIYVDDWLTISGSGSLQAVGSDAQWYSYGLYADDLTVGDGVTLTAISGDAETTYNFFHAETAGICVSDDMSIGKANITATGDETTGKLYGYSCGIACYGELEIGDGAVVNATGGTAIGTGETSYQGYAYSEGIDARGDITIGKAKVTATGGTTNAKYYGYSHGIYGGQELTICDGAEVKAVGGTSTATGRDDAFGYVYSRGIYTGKTITVGKAKLTAQGGEAEGQYYAVSYGIDTYDDVIFNDGAEVSLTGDSATATGCGGYRYYGQTNSSALYARGTLTIGKAKVTASSGDSVVLTTGVYFDSDDDEYIYGSAYSYSVSVSGLKLKSGGKLTTTGGTATYKDPNDNNKQGKYVDAYSTGLYVRGTSEICGTLITTGGSTYGQYDAYTEDNTTTTYGGDSGSFGMICYYGDMTVKSGANVKTTSAHAETNTTEGGYAYSNGIFMAGGDVVLEGGALYAVSGTVKDGAENDTIGIYARTYRKDGEAPTGGALKVSGGWLKVESNTIAIMTRTGITLTDVQVTTPEGGTVAVSDNGGVYYTIQDGEDEDATVVLIWDGTTPAFTETSSGSSSSSGGSSGSTTSTTTKNPDGSTTTTTTNKKTGEVTETTTAENGTTSTVVTDQEGNVTEISANVPASAAKDGAAVTLPIDEVEAADSENAQEITVNVPSGGATVEIPVKNPTPGTVAVIVDEDGTETVIPGAKITENGIEVTLTEGATIKIVDNSKAFDDVKETDYFSNAVAWAYSRGITGGTSANTFGPHESCTRAQLVTFLWKAAGQPEAKGESGFADVSADTYYAKAVAWAFEKGIVSGYGEGLFGSDDTITREQMAVILYRFAQSMGMDTTQGGMQLREFKDYESISSYAVAAVQWAVNAGVMAGSEGSLLPGQPCTRAQIVTMLYSLLGK